MFDFDGVLTDNFVYVDQSGRETVRCSRADGLAFDALRRTPLKLFILSTEKNAVVRARGRKLKVPVFQGLPDKSASIQALARREKFSLRRTLFVGNDVNDLAALRLCGYSACPSDSHPAVLQAAAIRLAAQGGHGAVRELVEQVMGLDVTPPSSRRVREAG